MIYLIDYENVNSVKGVDKLTEEDTVIIFYSKNANLLTFEAHAELMSAKARIEYKNVSVGTKKALDFQLVTYLGYLIRANEKTHAQYCIISKDNGFSHIANFWREEKGLEIGVFTNLSGKTQKHEAEENNSALTKALKASQLKLKDDETEATVRIIGQFKTKQAINTNLSKYFRDNDKVGAINKIIKPFIKNKK